MKIDEYTEDVDFNVVSDLIVNFVRRGRLAQDYGIDESGRIVVENDGSLARGVYGIELRGYYNGKPWRFYERDVFVIVDEYDESDSGIDEENVLTYDGTFDISFGGDGVSAAFVADAINAHNNDEGAHPSMLAQVQAALSTSLAGIQSVLRSLQRGIDSHAESLTAHSDIREAIGTAQQDISDIQSLLVQIQQAIEESGKVDDVKVNGVSVVEEKVANLTIPENLVVFGEVVGTVDD